MSSSRYQYFRWTRRTALITINYVILVPSIIGVAAYATDVRSENPASDRDPRSLWKWKGKADLIVDNYRASGTSGRSGREIWLLNTRPVGSFRAIRRDSYTRQAKTGRGIQKMIRRPTLRFVQRNCYTPGLRTRTPCLTKPIGIS